MLNSDVTFPAGDVLAAQRHIAAMRRAAASRKNKTNTGTSICLGQQMSCMRDCIASMFDEQAGLRSKTHAAVQLATTCENTVYAAVKSVGDLHRTLLGTLLHLRRDCSLCVADHEL